MSSESASQSLANDIGTLEALTSRWEELGLSDATLLLDATQTFVPEEARTLVIEGDRPPLRRMATGTLDGLPELEMLGTLGEGGMGLVRLARQLALEREVAVKTLREGVDDPIPAAQLLREAGITGLLEHPNIVPIYTLGQNNAGAPLIVMKRIEGKTWSHYLAHPDELVEAGHDDVLVYHLEILMQVCNAVHFAHSRGILHRDLKPDNVMIGEFGEVYVLDWGIAVSMREEHGRRFPLARDVRGPAGTPVYMAPEMATGQGLDLGTHTDVYLLGAMLHEILTGRAPHSGTTLMQVLFAAVQGAPPVFDASVPAELAQICTTALAADPAKRFASAEALRKAIVEHMHHRTSHELARNARQRLEVLEMLREADSEEHAAQIQRAYTEARFGFEQALHVWEANEDARRGRVQLLEQMIEVELARRNHKACELLLAELETPPAALTAAVQALNKELAGEERELDVLRLRQRDEDPSLGRGGRGVFVGLMALLTLFPTALHLSSFEAEWATNPSPRLYFVNFSGFVLASLLGIYLGRRTLLQNKASRRIVTGILVGLGAVVLHRANVMLLDLPVRTALGQELIIYALGITMMSISRERRLRYSVPPFLIGAVLVGAFPAMAFNIFNITIAVGLTIIALVWRPTGTQDEADS